MFIGHDRFGQAGGRWLGSLPHFFRLVAVSRFTSQLPSLDFSAPDKKKSMAVLKGLLAAGKLTPVIDRTYPLSEVPEAIRYLEAGGARGRIVITP